MVALKGEVTSTVAPARSTYRVSIFESRAWHFGELHAECLNGVVLWRVVREDCRQAGLHQTGPSSFLLQCEMGEGCSWCIDGGGCMRGACMACTVVVRIKNWGNAVQQ